MTPEDRLGHRQRLREKFERLGHEAFLDYELLELILTYSIPRRDVKPIAKALMNRFHTYPAVLDASPNELAKIPDLGQNSINLLRLIRSSNLRYLDRTMESLPLMDSPKLFADYARTKLGCETSESVLAFFLNTQNRLISCETVGSGTIDAVSVFPADIAKKILDKGAYSVVLCHNHPGGSFLPSRDDDAITFGICKALAPLGIILLDHVVVSRFGYYSYRQHEHERGRNNLLTKFEGE